ncbi:MAG TPA: SIS domain-containing protein [Firmicutes bacterium]|nr:SIS domain-containing protein [Bacillota bacterium]
MANIIDYINEQPNVLRQVTNYGLDLEKFSRVFLVGTGSSLNAAFAVKYVWKKSTSKPVTVCDPLSFVLEYLDKITEKTLVVGISQSGSSKVTIDALQAAKDGGACTIGVTAETNSALAAAAEKIIPIPCGEELVGAKTKGYSCTVAVLTKMAQASYDQEQLSSLLGERLQQNDALCRELAQELADCQVAYIIGAIGHYGTAREIALKTMEIVKIPTLSFELEDSMHGPLNALNERAFVMVLTAGDELAKRQRGLAKILTSLNARGAVIRDGLIRGVKAGQTWEIPAWKPDLVRDIVPAQLFCWYLALAKGEEPTYFRYDRSMVSKITKVVK